MVTTLNKNLFFKLFWRNFPKKLSKNFFSFWQRSKNLEFFIWTISKIKTKIVRKFWRLFGGFISKHYLKSKYPLLIIFSCTGCWFYYLDLMFLVDGSGSIREGEFSLVIDFVKQIASSFDLTNHNIGVLQYSHWYSGRLENLLMCYSCKQRKQFKA